VAPDAVHDAAKERRAQRGLLAGRLAGGHRDGDEAPVASAGL
jgi:hypothetical protein